MVHRAAAAAYAAMFKELIDGPSTVPELVEATGMHENTVRKFIQAMYHVKAMEQIGIDRAKDGRLKVKIHALTNWKRKAYDL